MSGSWSPTARHSTRPRRRQVLADGRLRLHILLVATAVPLLTRLPPAWLEAVMEPRRVPAPAPSAEIQRLITTTNAVLRRGRPLVRPSCLTRGLTRYYFLRRAGLDVALCFGIGEVAGRWEGHCWLVVAGEPFLEPRDPRHVFTPLYTIPTDSRRTRADGPGPDA